MLILQNIKILILRNIEILILQNIKILILQIIKILILQNIKILELQNIKIQLQTQNKDNNIYIYICLYTSHAAIVHYFLQWHAFVRLFLRLKRHSMHTCELQCTFHSYIARRPWHSWHAEPRRGECHTFFLGMACLFYGMPGMTHGRKQVVCLLWETKWPYNG